MRRTFAGPLLVALSLLRARRPHTSPPWPTPATAAEANLKQITLRVSSTTRFLTGRREFVVSAIKIAG